MIRSWLFIVTVTSLSICICNCLLADERDERMYRSAAIKQEVAELRKNGHSDEAEKELHGLRTKLEQLERAVREAKDRNAEGEVQEIRARAKEIHLEIEKIESRRSIIPIPPPFQERAEKLEFMARRCRHLQAAAENLKAAEMHDMAHEVMKRVEHLEFDLGQSKRELATAIRLFHEDRHAEEARHQLREGNAVDGDSPLHRELESLRKELRVAQEELKRLQLERDRQE